MNFINQLYNLKITKKKKTDFTPSYNFFYTMKIISKMHFYGFYPVYSSFKLVSETVLEIELISKINILETLIIGQ